MKKVSIQQNTIKDSVLGWGKRGFTLAELLITLGIIGIISAILLPNILKSKPDENKAMCVTSYNALKTSLRHIIQEHNNFPGGKEERAEEENHIIHRYDYDKYPLATLAAGQDKSLICRRIATYMDADGERCSENYVTEDNVRNNNGFAPTFTKNGVDWFITTNRIPNNNMPTQYQTDVYIDVNGEKGDNCLYNADTCINPDRFKFTIAANGRVVPADAVSNEYIRTQHNWFKNKNANLDDFNGDIIAGIIPIPEELVCMPCYVKNGDSCELDLTNPECQLIPPPPPGLIKIQLMLKEISENNDDTGLKDYPCAKYCGEGTGGCPHSFMDTSLDLYSDGDICIGKVRNLGHNDIDNKSHYGEYWVDGQWYKDFEYNEKFKNVMGVEEHKGHSIVTGKEITATVTSGNVSSPIDIYYTDKNNQYNGCTISSSTNSCTITINTDEIIDLSKVKVIDNENVEFDWEGKKNPDAQIKNGTLIK